MVVEGLGEGEAVVELTFMQGSGLLSLRTRFS